MEAYVSTCKACKKIYRWIGYKTGIGKTPEQLEQMSRERTVCKFCGVEGLETALDEAGLVGALDERAAIDEETENFRKKLLAGRNLL